MRVMTILGTRPEIIRLSLIIGKLDASCEHVLVHTGQNYDFRLNQMFFEQLGLRAPDVMLDVRGGTPGEIMSEVLLKCERILMEHNPDKLLVLGDTYSGLSAIVARRIGIPVYHMEAGNRCFDFNVPEEINRRIIDHVSSVLLPYTEVSRRNLLREGFEPDRVYVTGNPIKEVLGHYAPEIAASGILAELEQEPKKYLLVTLHRAENVDNISRLTALFEGLSRAAQHFAMPVICSVHPRTRDRLRSAGLQVAPKTFILREPFGFFDFVKLEQNAFCVLTDSGTVQEETCLFGVPNVTLRDVTERPETIECGSNTLAGADPDTMLSLVGHVTSNSASWSPPREYLVRNVADIVTRIVLSYRAYDLGLAH